MKLKTLTFLVLSLLLSQSLKAQWTKIYGPTYERGKIFFTSANIGYATGAGFYASTIKTVNGGSTWSYVSSSRADVIYFTSNSVGYLAGVNQFIEKTINAGTSWTYQSYSAGTQWHYFDLSFPTTNTGYVVGENGIIRKTVNGGANWIAQSSGTTETLYSVSFVNDSLGYIVGSNGLIKKTSDGGVNWVTQTSGTNQTLYKIFFTSALIGHAVGGGGIMLKTTNGGTNWYTQTIVTNQSLHDIVFVDADTGYAVGEGGTLLKTINAGAFWGAQPSGVSTNLYSISFPDSLTGYIAGYNPDPYGIYDGIILKTTNGGGPIYSCSPVLITAQPQDTAICSGNNATFSVMAYGASPFSYHWYKNGVLVDSTISTSSHSDNYTTSILSTADSGSMIYCVVTNQCWDNTTTQATSDTANLPVHSSCAPVSIVNGVNSQSFTLGSVTSIPFSITVSGTPPFIYKWYVDNVLSKTDTVLSNSSSFLYYINNFTSPGTYAVSCTVSNCFDCGSGSGSNSINSSGTLDIYCVYGSFSSSPSSQTKTTCETATFNASFTGGAWDLDFRWYRNGVLIPGATSLSYTTPTLTIADNGSSYYCLATWCAFGLHYESSQTSTATLSIIQPASILQQPVNQYLLPGTSTTFSTSVNGPPPFSYYWYTNGVVSSSTLNTTSTNSSFTTPSLTLADTGNSYYCIITNGAGCYSVTSDTAHFNCASFNSISPTACDSFSINGQTYTASGIYTQTLVSQSGCDSTLTINLAVTNLVDSIFQNGATLNSSIAGAIYQWVDCENGLAPIAGATSQSFNPTVNGFYALIISKGLCVDTSVCYNVNSVGINKLDFEDGISIFPSPVKNVLQIASALHLINEINIYNSIGALLIQQKQNKMQVSIDLSSYANGIYFAEIKTATMIFRRKVLKE
ncbi:MAG: T9SS type A sorting domain-containing protein [Bacteroidetes bacterium]|nr:T9SS type A sorting domain-containing protein [Bacteroidota bacterium]MBK9673576.1 T9SS type A sorting domain-containing protein [Bacteroidota bacterium]MBP6412999.1 T9SS type A sorting domain-containing protein [Bacteroidia bacterium]